MKKLVILTMVVALFIGIPFCVFAQEESRAASASCKKFAESCPEAFDYWYKSMGECVSYVQTCIEQSGRSGEWCTCRARRFVDPYYFETFGSWGLGPCISRSP